MIQINGPYFNFVSLNPYFIFNIYKSMYFHINDICDVITTS